MTAFQNDKSNPATSLQLYQLFSIVPSLHLNGLSFLSSGTSLQVTNNSKDDGGYSSYTQNLINLKNHLQNCFPQQYKQEETKYTYFSQNKGYSTSFGSAIWELSSSLRKFFLIFQTKHEKTSTLSNLILNNYYIYYIHIVPTKFYYFLYQKIQLLT